MQQRAIGMCDRASSSSTKAFLLILENVSRRKTTEFEAIRTLKICSTNENFIGMPRMTNAPQTYEINMKYDPMKYT